MVCELLGKSCHQMDKACDRRLDRLISYFHFTSGQVFSRTPTLRVTWQTPNQRQEACCAFWEAAHSCRVAGLARRRQLFHMAVPKQLLSHQALVKDWNSWDTVTDVLESLAGRNPTHNNKPKKTKSLMADKRFTDSIDLGLAHSHISSPRASLIRF